MDSEPCKLILKSALVVDQSAPLLCCFVLASFRLRIGSLAALRGRGSLQGWMVQLEAHQSAEQIVKRAIRTVFDIFAKGVQVD